MAKVIDVINVGKVYQLYDKPIDRLKEFLNPFHKKYHTDFTALKSVNFSVVSGETIGVIGRNGAGKSTLLKIITGVLSQSVGSVRVSGRISSLLELGTGFDPQLSGLENIYFNGSLLGISKSEMKLKEADILNFADIGEFINQPVRTYSSGMFARLAFAVAINVEPTILIVDEILSVGDSRFQKKCIDKIMDLRKKDVTILFVSHDEYLVRSLCQKALYLKNGEQVFFGEVEECLNEYKSDLVEGILEKNEAVVNEKKEIAEFSFSITDVVLLNQALKPKSNFNHGEDLIVSFKYELIGNFDGSISFVINLYTTDDIYVCGSTSIMDNYPVVIAEKEGKVEVTFHEISLLSGKYKLRVAVNDDTGIGIFCEANPACEFTVTDNFEAVGIVHMKRSWSF